MMKGFITAYLIVGLCIFIWGSWRDRHSLVNVFRDFTLSSAVAMMVFLLFLLVPLWPLVVLSWVKTHSPKEIEEAKVPEEIYPSQVEHEQ
jgi:hypothetical protein